jgi:hypothetical protein
MWRTRWLEHIEIAKQATRCANTRSIGCFDPERFQRAHAKSIRKLIAAKIGVELPAFPLRDHRSFFANRTLQRMNEA